MKKKLGLRKETVAMLGRMNEVRGGVIGPVSVNSNCNLCPGVDIYTECNTACTLCPTKADTCGNQTGIKCLEPGPEISETLAAVCGTFPTSPTMYCRV